MKIFVDANGTEIKVTTDTTMTRSEWQKFVSKFTMYLEEETKKYGRRHHDVTTIGNRILIEIDRKANVNHVRFLVETSVSRMKEEYMDGATVREMCSKATSEVRESGRIFDELCHEIYFGLNFRMVLASSSVFRHQLEEMIAACKKGRNAHEIGKEGTSENRGEDIKI